MSVTGEVLVGMEKDGGEGGYRSPDRGGAAVV